jgi:hypothetical protein
MRWFSSSLACLFVLTGMAVHSFVQTPEAAAQTIVISVVSSIGPSDAKARRTYDEAMKLLSKGQDSFALDGFRKADKQDGGGCIVCEKEAWKAAMALGACLSKAKSLAKMG